MDTGWFPVALSVAAEVASSGLSLRQNRMRSEIDGDLRMVFAYS